MDECNGKFPLGGDGYATCEAALRAGVTHWYDQAWFPVTVIGLLVVLVGIVGYIAYTRKTA